MSGMFITDDFEYWKERQTSNLSADELAKGAWNYRVFVESFRRQEAKPLNVEWTQADEDSVEWAEYRDREKRKIVAEMMIEKFKAALPTDQSERIKELEAEIEEQRLKIVELMNCTQLEAQIIGLQTDRDNLEAKIARALEPAKIVAKWCHGHSSDDAPDDLAIPAYEVVKILEAKP